MAGEWASSELEAVLDAYFAMLEAELAGEAYVKAKYNRAVQDATGRGKGSVEFKFQNISAVLQDLGRAWIAGYKPRSNYQMALRTAVKDRLRTDRLHWLPRDGDFESGLSRREPPTSSRDDVTDYIAALRRVPERSFGGADVAVAPDREQDTFWPEGPAAPGADEVIRWLRGRLGEDDGPVMGFLVGGPGNGKSFLSASLVEGMSQVDMGEDGLAHRAYTYLPGGPRRLRLVNDATISPSAGGHDDGGAFLVADIEEAFEAGEHLVANVNRGILFEELSKGVPGGLGYLLAQWLHGVEPAAPGGWEFEPVKDEHYFRSAIAHAPDGRVVEAVAVFMDVCSLFERRPAVSLSELGPVGHDSEVGRYEVARLDKRASWDAGATPAGTVLASFVARFPRPAAGESVAHDPFAANLESLSAPDVQRGIVTILRSAELASAKRFTYRELWGAIGRLVIGGSSNEARAGWRGPFSLVEAAAAGGDVGLEDLLRLAGYRYHQALFDGAPAPLLRARGGRPTPVTRLTALVDPVRDARAGLGEAAEGWATPVLEAFAGHAIGDSPLEALLAMTPSNPVAHATTRFDHLLDAAISEAMSPASGLADKDKRHLVAWYGQYLARLYATANAIPAFRNELQLWTRAWARADGASPPPGPLEAGLRTLLLPSLDPDSPQGTFVLPALESRTLPVSSRPDDPRLVVQVPHNWGLTTSRDGDAIFVQLNEGGHARVELELDFAMLREALACNEGHVGVTEFTDTASPRLERFRAALLRPDGGALRYGIVSGDDVHELEVTS